MGKRFWLVAAVWALAACQQQTQSPTAPAGAKKTAAAEPCKLDVGWDPWEPYQYETADGTIAGLDIDVIDALAQTAGCNLHYVRGNWSDHLAAMRTGEIDLLLAATPNPQRESFAQFSATYRAEDMAMFVRSEDLPTLQGQSLRELVEAGHRIGVTDGYYYGPDVAALMADESTAGRFVRARIVESGYARLVDGQVDVLLDDPVVAASVLRRKGWTEAVAQHPQLVSEGEVALMFSRAGVPAAIVQRFEKAIQISQLNGKIDAVIARYRDTEAARGTAGGS